MNEKSRVDLSRYVSNLDRNVYTIFNLPEEVIAVIFAYVSRSPASFRDNLRKLLEDEELAVDMNSGSISTAFSEKAARFHEKWVVGYGHSSVAEHAVAHIGIERISRLASAELELANTFNSFTEYSQRYQRPGRGDVYVPPELDEVPELKSLFLSLNEEAFDVYEHLMTGLISHLEQTEKRGENETERAWRLRLEKIAFEDARYVLTLATLTNLGMTGNGRALRDTLVRLLSSPHEECRRLARDMEREISRVIPTLLKYVKPNEYLTETRDSLKSRLSRFRTEETRGVKGPSARFTFLPDYAECLSELATHLLVREASLSWEEAARASAGMSLEEKERIAEEALFRLRFFDNPLDELNHLTYRMEMKISEANWHQLLRHNRRTHFTWSDPVIRFGFTVPPHIRDAGLEEPFCAFIARAEDTFRRLEAWNPLIARYAVTNAHHRQVTASATLWELYHLINLRTSPEAQWDIRETFEQLHRRLQEAHPVLARFAQRRLG